MERTMKTKYVAGLSMALLSTQVLAADDNPQSSWKAEAELGFISTSGNTETETLNAKAKVINEREKWKNTVIAEATRVSNKDIDTAHRYFLSGKIDYNYSDISYIFGLLNYEDDRFSGYDYQTSLIIGYGRKLIKNDTVNMEAELGVGTRRSELTTGVTNDEGLLYGAMNLDWKISKSASFNEKITVEIGDDATTTKSVSGLKAKINSKLASKITYTVKHVSDVPVGIEKTDRETAVTLVYNF